MKFPRVFPAWCGKGFTIQESSCRILAKGKNKDTTNHAGPNSGNLASYRRLLLLWKRKCQIPFPVLFLISYFASPAISSCGIPAQGYSPKGASIISVFLRVPVCKIFTGFAFTARTIFLSPTIVESLILHFIST